MASDMQTDVRQTDVRQTDALQALQEAQAIATLAAVRASDTVRRIRVRGGR